MRKLLSVAIVTLVLGPSLALAQDPTPAPVPAPVAAPAPDPTPAPPPVAMIRPGMTEADVRASWGDPAIVKHANEWTYLFYRNYEEHRVGWLDVVFLQNGQVVDCIHRGSGRGYAGQSSSPPDRVPGPTLPAEADSTAGAVTGVRVHN
ncbi:MAG TPA: outer membrane protein assembly factor BamE [Gemmatimonadales bacterium]|jgi:hypothetical protein